MKLRHDNVWRYKTPKVVFVGTSFSGNRFNFDGMLAQQLSSTVLNKALSGGGFENAIIAYLGSEAFRKHPPKFLVWEIPGYKLFSKDSRDSLYDIILVLTGVCNKKVNSKKEAVNSNRCSSK